MISVKGLVKAYSSLVRVCIRKMSLINDGLFYILAVCVTTALIGISYLKWNLTYWKRVGLLHRKPIIPFGNFLDTVKQTKSFGEVITEIYAEMKEKGARHAGLYFFHMPVYMPMEPQLIKLILQNDFDHFTGRGTYFNEKDDPLSAHLFSLEGAKWKNVRVKLTPTFTSGKMKMMFPLVLKTSSELKTVLDSNPSGQVVDMKDILARLTTDIVGNCAFGLDCNSLRDPDCQFRTYGKRFLNLTTKEVVKAFVGFASRDVMRFFGLKIIPEDVAKFFIGAVRNTIDFRQVNGIERKDFLQLLIHMQNETEGTKFTLEELAAHAFFFYAAGFEPSSTVMTMSLLELSLNQDLQQKLRDEINDTFEKHGGEFTYEAMMEMRYMDMVLNETLRKYPTVSAIPRMCSKDYKIPTTDIVLKKGTRVFIPAQGLHHDPDYFENPEVFDPSRFSDENKQNIKPFTFMPFGEGPRLCIGMRFAQMQTKVGLAILLKHYRFQLNPQTKLPLKKDPRNFINTLVEGVWMNVEKISAQ